MILVILVLNIDLGPRVCMEPNKMETVKRKSGWRRGIFPRFQMDRIFRHVFYLSVCVVGIFPRSHLRIGFSSLN